MTPAVTTPNVETGRPGRPRSFDEEAVLDALMELFWVQGYEATSMTDIVETSGLNKSSLYNTFGSKEQLFNRILQRYIERRMSLLTVIADEVGPGIDALHQVLAFVRDEMDTEMGRQGCLAINTATEFGRDDPRAQAHALTFRSGMRDSLRRVVGRAAEDGDLDIEQLDSYADILLMFLMGLTVVVRAGADEDELDRLVDAAHATVEGWRLRTD